MENSFLHPRGSRYLPNLFRLLLIRGIKICRRGEVSSTNVRGSKKFLKGGGRGGEGRKKGKRLQDREDGLSLSNDDRSRGSW